MPAPSNWNDERVERLKQMVKDGLTAGQIASDLGLVTRSGVIGKCHRLGLKLGGRAAALPAGATPKPKAVRGRTVATPQPPQPSAPTPARPPREVVDRKKAFAPLPASQPKHWTDRRFGECTWPVGGEGADLTACCRPVLGGTWRAEHNAMGRAPPRPDMTARALMRQLRRHYS